LGQVKSIILDTITRALVMIGYAHKELHDGRMFHVGVSQSVTDTNNITALVFSTPLAGGREIHLVAHGSADDAVEYKLIETPSVDEAEGTSQLTIYNKNRNSSNLSGLFDADPVKGTGGVFEWTGVGEESDQFTIGDDLFHVSALEGSAPAGSFWVDLGDAQAATMVTNATAAIDAAQATTANAATVEATDGTGNTIDVIADGYGVVGNLTLAVVTGANMAAAVSITGGVGAPNDGGDAEIHGTANQVTYLDKTDAAAANITTTVALIDELFGSSVNPNNQTAGASRDQSEWVLKQGTQYCLYMKSLNANDNVHRLAMDFYEHTPKDGTNEY